MSRKFKHFVCGPLREAMADIQSMLYFMHSGINRSFKSLKAFNDIFPLNLKISSSLLEFYSVKFIRENFQIILYIYIYLILNSD